MPITEDLTRKENVLLKELGVVSEEIRKEGVFEEDVSVVVTSDFSTSFVIPIGDNGGHVVDIDGHEIIGTSDLVNPMTPIGGGDHGDVGSIPISIVGFFGGSTINEPLGPKAQTIIVDIAQLE